VAKAGLYGLQEKEKTTARGFRCVSDSGVDRWLRWFWRRVSKDSGVESPMAELAEFSCDCSCGVVADSVVVDFGSEPSCTFPRQIVPHDRSWSRAIPSGG
jgi:hypothetical protein